MDYYANAVPAPQMFNWALAPYDPKKEVPRTLSVRTEFATKGASAVDFFTEVKGPLAPTAAPHLQQNSIATTAPVGDLQSSSTSTIEKVLASQTNLEIDRIAKQRVRLMAAKYAASVESSEIIARLEILNRRLLDRSPRVSKDQVVALENANEQLSRIRAAREERSKRLGISA